MFLARYIEYIKRVIKEIINNATSDALKNLSRKRDRRRNLIKVKSQKLIYKRGSVILSILRHTLTKVEGKTVIVTAIN
jgi:hypothetical protein